MCLIPAPAAAPAIAEVPGEAVSAGDRGGGGGGGPTAAAGEGKVGSKGMFVRRRIRTSSLDIYAENLGI
jgi:hypothetical protein